MTLQRRKTKDVFHVIPIVLLLLGFFVLFWVDDRLRSTQHWEVGRKACNVTEAKGQCWEKNVQGSKEMVRKYVLSVIFRRASDPLAYLKGKGLVWAVTVIGGMRPV